MHQQEPELNALPDAHFHHALTNLPDWVLKASPTTRAALKGAPLHVPDWHANSTHQQRQSAKQTSEEYWTARNHLEARLARMQSARDFAEARLTAALKTRFGLELDVKTTFLRLYIPQDIPWFPIKSGAARTWTVSLLDAALHNFQDAETKADAYESASTFITPPSPSGQFDTLPEVKRRLSIQDFTRLCRELDIGGQYETYLKEFLGFTQPVTAAVLETSVMDTHKAAFKAASEMAVMRGDLTSEANQLMIDFRTLRGHDLTIMSSALTGIVVFTPELDRSTPATPIIA
jgi:hypothetical protein